MAQTMLRDYLQEIEDAISSGRSDEALSRCQTILAQFPESLEAQRLLGEVYLAQGHLEEAQQTFDWVLTNDPENVIAYCDRALVSERALDYDTALDCYQQAYELSQGNSQIRQQFNLLSMKAGQQGFMFSRAGLARLYMRGDLLIQAIQEWEVVLAGTPERLDARTGLLETCWREGLFDRVEQLAKQILQDVPGCLKALLLLAYVISGRNMQHAQELLLRANALDPDRVMAHELFSDLLVARPDEPFLQLLNGPSAVILESSAQANREEAYALVASTPNVSETASNWNSSDSSLKQEISPFFQLPNDPVSSSDPWSVVGKLPDPMPQQDFSSPVAQLGTDITQIAPWSTTNRDMQQYGEPQPEQLVSHLEQQSSTSQDQAMGQQLWNNQDVFTGLSAGNGAGSLGNGSLSGPPSTWGIISQDEKLPSPPAWLDMLSQGERQQLSGGMPAMPPLGQMTTLQQPSGAQPRIQPVNREEPRMAPIIQQPSGAQPRIQPVNREEPRIAPIIQQPSEAQPRIQPVNRQEPKVVLETGTDEDASPFGPEWLKSLGAASIDEPDPIPPLHVDLPVASAVQEYPQPTEVPAWVTQLSPFSAPSAWPTPVAEPSWANEMLEPAPTDRLAEPTEMKSASHVQEETEQNLLTTLEDLEKNLLSEGFIPLQPNSLSAIAQQVTSTEIVAPEPPQMEALNQELTLSAAFAELGDFVAGRPPQEDSHIASAAIFPPTQMVSAQAPAPVEEPKPIIPQSPASVPSLEPFEFPRVSPVPSSPVPQSTNTPVARREAVADDELEMTIKRPAIRVQPMQRSFSQRDQALSTNRTGGRIVTGNGTDGNLNYQERLIQGYQHQLIGNYDEAMQEYRIIIRSAPEVLGEVISNVRALLKLTPKYSAGYRVLGDAYMRQGEYLQAMEAYNKALTMAKKAKG